MKRIVVGTDLTARSSGAVSCAAQLAEVQGAVLHLVTVVAPPVAPVELPGVPSVPMADTGQARDAVERQLAGEAERLRRQGIQVETHVCSGSASDMLCRVAETVDADLIVVGNRRMTGAGRLLGSVPNRVAHHAPCSVLIARTGD